MGNAVRRSLLLGALALGLAGPAQARDELLYVGMHGTDIRLAHFDPATGAITPSTVVASGPRPTWQVYDARRHVLYSVDESGNDGKSHGHVLAYRVTPGSGALTLINTIDAGGGGTTYLHLDARSDTLLAANYGTGSVASFPIHGDGSIGEAASVIQDEGSGPHPRQKSAHAHAVTIDPTGHFALVADLGADRVFVYPFDAAGHALRKADPATGYVAPPGSGPRHTVFSRDGRLLYLLDELSGDLVTLAWDRGHLAERDRQGTLGAGFAGAPSVSELLISPDGRFLYVGSRAESQVLVYRLTGGLPRLIQRMPSGGQNPWSFAFDTTGRWVIVANLQSDQLAALRRDPATGRLTDSGQRASSPQPVAVTAVVP
jgi:6-phosphogluconolactonase